MIRPTSTLRTTPPNPTSKKRQRGADAWPYRARGLGLVLGVWLNTAALAMVWADPAQACAPDLPRAMLTAGEAELCAASPLSFPSAVARVVWGAEENGPKGGAAGLPRANTRSAADAEALDVAAALRAAGRDDEQIATLSAQWSALRERVESESESESETVSGWASDPEFSAVVAALPAEFSRYLGGAVAWRSGERSEAQVVWRELLALPANMRRYKTVWAAYMLAQDQAGSSGCDVEDRAWAQVRELAAVGFVDSQGLAAASWGEQARCWLEREGDVVRALHLYARQVETGQIGAPPSLAIALRRAFEVEPKNGGRARLRAMARDPLSRALAGVWLAANPEAATRDRARQRWLEALEAEVEPDAQVSSAGPMAWTSYQSNDLDEAGRWAALAGTDDWLARWVAAKLELRSGDVAAASRELAWVEAQMRGASAQGEPELRTRDGRFGESSGPAPEAARATAAELGVLLVQDGRFVDALLAFERAQSMLDAAYIAESVLTLDELQATVDAHFPGDPSAGERAGSPAAGESAALDDFVPPGAVGARIRWLLARRMARGGDWKGALPYYPTALQPAARAQARGLAFASALAGRGRLFAGSSAEARALWEVAERTRTLGMELLGTELGPDWTLHGGRYKPDDLWSTRAHLEGLSAPRRAERGRVAAPAPPRPSARFHYRYAAADLAEAAADLLPAGHPAAAPMLCLASAWVQHADWVRAVEFERASEARARGLDLQAYVSGYAWLPEGPGCRADPGAIDIPGFGGAEVASGPRFSRAQLERHGWPLLALFGVIAGFGSLLVLGPSVGPGKAGARRSIED